jgi:hypothetical protein
VDAPGWDTSGVSDTRSSREPPPAVTHRQAWARLGLLAGVLGVALASVAFGFAWLIPTDLPSKEFEYALADLEVGVPVFYRPVNMGAKGGRPDGIWLVRLEDGGVDAFWSRPVHPVACPVVPAEVTVSIRSPQRGEGTPTPVARLKGPATPEPEVLGFREPASRSTSCSMGHTTSGRRRAASTASRRASRATA